MRNIWVKIGLMAGGIFAIGVLIVAGVRAGKAKASEFFNSSDPFRIPLMGIVPFNLGDQRLGDLRRLTLLRDAPDHITSVKLEARLGDSATTAPLKDCAYLTVSDLTANNQVRVDNHLRFTCVSDTAGLGSFGTVEIAHRQGGERTTLVRTLVLTPAEIQEIQQSMSSHNRLDPEQRARLESMRDSLEAMGDSIRAAAESAAEGSSRTTIVAPSAGGTRGTATPTPPPTPSRSAPAAPKAPATGH